MILGNDFCDHDTENDSEKYDPELNVVCL